MTKPTNGGSYRAAPKTEVLNQRRDYTETESWTLVALVQEGNTEAYAVLYRRYYREILGHIARGNVDYHTAEDLAADVFTAIFTKVSNVTRRGRDPGGLFRVMARNRLVDYHRQRARRPDIIPLDADHVVTIPDPRSDPANLLINPALVEVLRKLSSHERQCVILRVVYDLSVKDTARIMGIPEGSVKSNLHRALRALAEMLTAGE